MSNIHLKPSLSGMLARAQPYLGVLGLSASLAALSPSAIAQTAPDWLTTGNAGSTPAKNFLGTTDAEPLVLKTHNLEALRILPNGSYMILVAGACWCRSQGWSGRWESNPHGRRFRVFKTSGLVRILMLSVISV
jgi:hypothetical protein